jgi:hypothetical protein
MSERASRLAERDPGARLGGNTHVVTGPGAGAFGGRRPDVMVGLGRRQMLLGKGGADHLVARGVNTTMRGGTGKDHLYARARGAMLVGGPAADLLVGTAPGATFRAAGADRVVAAGDQAQIECPAGVRNAVVVAGRDADVDPACSTNGATIQRPARQPSPHSVTGPHAALVTGDGSNDRPYVAPCDDPSADPCTVSSFAARGLTGPLANEYVPAYSCPRDHPWLLAQKFSPPFTVIPDGVEVEEQLPWAIGISISGQSWFPPQDAGPPNRLAGTTTGFPSSSATHYSFGTHYYRIKLHCTRTCDLGYDLTGQHPCNQPTAAAMRARRDGAARP